MNSLTIIYVRYKNYLWLRLTYVITKKVIYYLQKEVFMNLSSEKMKGRSALTKQKRLTNLDRKWKKL